MFDWLTSEVSNNPLTYAVVFAAAASDVLVPLIPSETIVIAAAVIAGQGDLLIYAIIAAATLGAVLGDNLVFCLGRRLGEPIAARLFRGGRSQARLRWAEREIKARGSSLIVLGRFIPGGRSATTFASGMLGMEYRRFLRADGCAAFLWALYISMLGFIGGASFEDNLWLPLLIALALASLVTAGVESWRRRVGLGEDAEASTAAPEGDGGG